VIEVTIARCGAPEHLPSDSGPEFIAHAIRDWLKERAIKTLYIRPGSPWGDAHIESLRDKLRDECLNNIVTEDVHVRRTCMLFQEPLGPYTRVGAIAVPNVDYDARRWWLYSQGVENVIDETVGYVYATSSFPLIEYERDKHETKQATPIRALDHSSLLPEAFIS
jgi:transposase InsO family protein